MGAATRFREGEWLDKQQMQVLDMREFEFHNAVHVRCEPEPHTYVTCCIRGQATVMHRTYHAKLQLHLSLSRFPLTVNICRFTSQCHTSRTKAVHWSSGTVGLIGNV